MNFESIYYNQEFYNKPDSYVKDAHKLLSIFNEKESENNWEKFNNALKQFKELSAQMVTSSDYNDILKSFSGAILNSINSERGALSKTALDVIGEISYLMKFNFESFIDIFFPTILEITGKSNNIFTQNGLNCLKKIITNTGSIKIIPQLFVQKTNKKKKIRQVVAECIETCLQHISTKKLYDYIDIIEQLIKEGIYDREQIIRDTYKKIYQSYKKIFNDNIVHRYVLLIYI
ncbi:hypothetical protein LY90DRAFT_456756 [Neocallimastix californiae]|uniref:CLASP N-terminal domain-containing protein n=1 Tax=Neocallimastix californiae TaxID=1754190 RepID=A0A1Y2CXK2_9FUNG|nr:hypothetical protein LY90DRAFT_456756 [Neocallimastix californiae]|eukprot:ORY51750.1 hypothetical protein LY90DRAFT_456756 [Neocallimastix californiae]